ncbi:MAG: long-chain fatty acid transport protein [Desulfobacteraceae bacterium]|nr:long-chain fatty acid transport protein [Desulfobacteraceae bacterium]
MKKVLMVLSVSLLITCVSSLAMAGGVDNKQNYSADYIGSASRNAETKGADAVAYNPAGIMHMENGFTAKADVQFIMFDYDHNYDGQEHEAEGEAIVPALFGVYKRDKWAAFGSFTIVGGGGTVEYDNGNSITRGISNAASVGAFTPTGYSMYEASTGTTRPNNEFLMPGGALSNEFAGVESYDYGFTAGLAYKFNEIFSVAAGLRYVITDKEVDIHGTYNDTYVLGKYDQEADGWGGVFGLNIKPNNTINIGFRYETKVKLDWDTTVDAASRGTIGENILWMNDRVNGQSYARDLPAVFACGIEWQVTPELTISPSYTVYFETDADWGAVQNEKTDDNSWDLSIAAQYAFTDKWDASLGYMYTDIGIDPNDFGIIEKMSPPLDCHTVGIGTQYKFNEKFLLSLGLMGNFYAADSADATATISQVEYDKIAYNFTIGFEYKFF